MKLLVKVEFSFLDNVSSSVYFGASQFKLEKFLGTNQAKLGRIYARRHCFKEQLLHFSVLLSAESSVVWLLLSWVPVEFLFARLVQTFQKYCDFGPMKQNQYLKHKTSKHSDVIVIYCMSHRFNVKYYV